MSAPVLLEERRGPVTVLTMNRPERANALDGELIEAVGAGFARAEADPAVQVVVLTGAGERVFCAGADLKGDTPGQPIRERGPGTEAFLRIHEQSISIPIIAAVNGHAVGGGFELVLAADMVVAAEHAEFGLPESRRGLIGAHGVVELGRQLPRALAMELTLTGDRISASRAAALGLVNQVVKGPELLDAAMALAARVCASAPLAVRATKRLLRELDGAPGARWPELKAAARSPLFGSEDAQEGARAFVEKRPPEWRGR